MKIAESGNKTVVDVIRAVNGADLVGNTFPVPVWANDATHYAAYNTTVLVNPLTTTTVALPEAKALDIGKVIICKNITASTSTWLIKAFNDNTIDLASIVTLSTLPGFRILQVIALGKWAVIGW